MVTGLLLLIAFILTIHHSRVPSKANKNNTVENNQGLVDKINNLTKGEVENFNEEVKNNVDVNEALNNVFNKNSEIEIQTKKKVKIKVLILMKISIITELLIQLMTQEKF